MNPDDFHRVDVKFPGDRMNFAARALKSLKVRVGDTVVTHDGAFTRKEGVVVGVRFGEDTRSYARIIESISKRAPKDPLSADSLQEILGDDYATVRSASLTLHGMLGNENMRAFIKTLDAGQWPQDGGRQIQLQALKTYNVVRKLMPRNGEPLNELFRARRKLTARIFGHFFNIVDVKNPIGVIIDDLATWGGVDSVFLDDSQRRFLVPTPKEKAVIQIEHRTIVNGQNINDLEDDEIFNLIAETEEEIARLSAIKSQPKKLQAKIENLQKAIDALGALIDAR